MTTKTRPSRNARRTPRRRLRWPTPTEAVLLLQAVAKLLEALRAWR